MKKIINLIGTIAFWTLVMVTIIACVTPKLKGTVTIEGDPMLGKTLTANIASLGGSGIITYQWLRDGSATIADTNSYTLQSADRDSVITVTVIRSDNSGSVTSSPVKGYGYLIGETGPGEGIIFYVNPNGFVMTDTGETVNYLEAAPVNQGSSLVWWISPGYNIPSITGSETAIGTGKANTAAILAVDANAPAAKACADYRGGGKSDWFLPSKDELNEMYKARTYLGISSGRFWSSSQDNYYLDMDAWVQNFADGDQGSYNKSNFINGIVRAVRAF